MIEYQQYITLASDGIAYQIILFKQGEISNQTYDKENPTLFFNNNANNIYDVFFQIPITFFVLFGIFAFIMIYNILCLSRHTWSYRMKVYNLLGLLKRHIKIYTMAELGICSFLGCVFGTILACVLSLIIIFIIKKTTGIEFIFYSDIGNMVIIIAIVMICSLIASWLFSCSLMNKITIYLPKRKKINYKKYTIFRCAMLEFRTNKKPFILLMLLAGISIVLLAYSVTYQKHFMKVTDYVEVDGKMPFDYDYEFSTYIRDTANSYVGRGTQVDVGNFDENPIIGMNSFELDGADEKFLAALQLEGGVDDVRGYREYTKAYTLLEKNPDEYLDMFDTIKDQSIYASYTLGGEAKQLYGYEQVLPVSTRVMGYSEEELQSMSNYVTEGTVNIERIRNGKEVILMVPAYYLRPVENGTYVDRVKPETEGAYNDTLFSVGDEITISSLSSEEEINGFLTEEMAKKLLSRQDRQVKIGAIIRTYVGWFENEVSPLTPYTILTVNDAFDTLSMAADYSRIRVYCNQKESLSYMDELMKEYNNQMPYMKLTAIQSQLASYKQYNLTLRVFVAILSLICIFACFITCSSQMLAKTKLFEKKYALLRICGFTQKNIRNMFWIQIVVIYLNAVILALLSGIMLAYVSEWKIAVSTMLAAAVLIMGVMIFSIIPCVKILKKTPLANILK